MRLTSLIALPLLRQASQDRLTDIITPVETILQNHYRVAISFIKPNIAGIPTNISDLIGDLLRRKLITHPRNIRCFFLSIIISLCGFSKSPIDGRNGCGCKMRAGIISQIAGATL